MPGKNGKPLKAELEKLLDDLQNDYQILREALLILVEETNFHRKKNCRLRVNLHKLRKFAEEQQGRSTDCISSNESQMLPYLPKDETLQASEQEAFDYRQRELYS